MSDSEESVEGAKGIQEEFSQEQMFMWTYRHIKSALMKINSHSITVKREVQRSSKQSKANTVDVTTVFLDYHKSWGTTTTQQDADLNFFKSTLPDDKLMTSDEKCYLKMKTNDDSLYPFPLLLQTLLQVCINLGPNPLVILITQVIVIHWHHNKLIQLQIRFPSFNSIIIGRPSIIKLWVWDH